VWVWRRCLWRTGVWMGWRRLRWNRGGTLENVDLGKKMRWSVDGGAIGGGLSSDAPRLLGKGGGVPSRGCRPGGAVGVRREAAADPRGCEPRGRLSRRDARDRFDRAVPSLRRRRRRWGSAATVSPAGTTGRLSSGVIGSVEGIGWMRGWNGAHLDRQRVGKSGDWEVASAIIVQHQAASPSVGQRSAARCRAN
jgi:hypothetical protein